jgi:hypothetical protein
MSVANVTVPKNIWRFEALLYASLLLDSLTAAFQGAPDDMDDGVVLIANVATALLILLFAFLVDLAANRRQNWARMLLLAALGLSVLSLFSDLLERGLDFASMFQWLSAALTAAGLYFSFTGDARGWFMPSRT